jgi:hypothetical protein
MRGYAVRLATAVGPILSGWMLASDAFGRRPRLAAAVKIAPDLTLLARFRRVCPPAEHRRRDGRGRAPSG